jgi:hypothetical protein
MRPKEFSAVFRTIGVLGKAGVQANWNLSPFSNRQSTMRSEWGNKVPSKTHLVSFPPLTSILLSCKIQHYVYIDASIHMWMLRKYIEAERISCWCWWKSEVMVYGDGDVLRSSSPKLINFYGTMSFSSVLIVCIPKPRQFAKIKWLR